jgi:hypothetical protein
MNVIKIIDTKTKIILELKGKCNIIQGLKMKTMNNKWKENAMDK